MTSAIPVFHGLIGQDHAARFLSAALARGVSSHAYLFLGPRGVGKQTAALKFAAALCCPDNGCGECPSCVKASRGIHPDIEVISPTGLLVQIDQVREVNRSLSLRPHESRARVFIFPDAEALNAESANAFLKSLEEPPSFVYFLLLATRQDRVLPTLVSRCQTVRFGPVPAKEIEAHLLKNCQARAVEATAFAHMSSGSLGMAVRLCSDPGLAQRRQRYLQIGQNLSKGAWEGGAAQMVAEITSAAQEAAAAAEADGGEADVPEGFIAAPAKRREEDAKRRARAALGQELAFALGVLQSWFRDAVVVAAGAGETVLNKDFELELEGLALPSRLTAYQSALDAIQATRAKLSYNIDVELALMAMFLKLQEVL